MYSHEQLRALPKIELHVHLEAAMSATTATALYNAKHAVPLSTQQWLEKQSVTSVHSFLQAWRRMQDTIQSVDDYFQVAQSACSAQADDGIVYCEMYVSVSAAVEKGLPLADVVAAIEAAAATEPRIQIKLIADFTRDYGEQHALRVLEELHQIQSPILVGVGLGGSEHHFPARLFKRLFEQAQHYGFQTTVHAGEMAGAEHIAAAIHQLHAQRIGHALHIAEQEHLYEHLQERFMTVEACPGSNLALGLIAERQAYPLSALLRVGVSVCINSDDPLLCGARLSEELHACAKAFQLTVEELKRLQRNALAAAFLDHDERAQLQSRLGWLYDT